MTLVYIANEIEKEHVDILYLEKELIDERLLRFTKPKYNGTMIQKLTNEIRAGDVSEIVISEIRKDHQITLSIGRETATGYTENDHNYSSKTMEIGYAIQDLYEIAIYKEYSKNIDVDTSTQTADTLETKKIIDVVSNYTVELDNDNGLNMS